MKLPSTPRPHRPLPVEHPLSLPYTLTLLVAATMAVASIAGLLYPTGLYPTEKARQAYLTNDVVNLIIGLPVLLSTVWFVRRGRLIGLLLWPGPLLYVLYNEVASVVGIPLGVVTLVHLALVAFSATALILLVGRAIDQTRVRVPN